MVETEALMSIRNTIAENVALTERPESLQVELLDELCAVDRQLGRTALFVMTRDQYQLPSAYVSDEQKPAHLTQETTLF